jgi:hypothetical protein
VLALYLSLRGKREVSSALSAAPERDSRDGEVLWSREEEMNQLRQPRQRERARPQQRRNDRREGDRESTHATGGVLVLITNGIADSLIPGLLDGRLAAKLERRISFSFAVKTSPPIAEHHPTATLHYDSLALISGTHEVLLNVVDSLIEVVFL